MNLRDWQLRARALFAPRRVERELDDELAFHIERETQRLISRGLTEGEARAKALARFGPVPLAADECRDARGTAFVDHTVRDILYALRTFKRAPLVAFTIVSTVALGLALVAVAFTMLNALLFRVDQVPDVHEMFAVERPRTSAGERQRFTRAQFDALRRETNVFTDAYGIVADVDSRLDGRRMFGTFVTGNFFQVLRVNAAIGRTLTPADDEPAAGQPVMVLSHRGWDRLFARDPAILGRELLVNAITFEIVGVMPEGFRGLAVGAPDDYWAPLSMLGGVRPIHRGPASNEADISLDIIGRLKPGLSRQTAQAGLAVWAAGQSSRAPSSDERVASTIALIPKRGTAEQPREAMLVTAPLFFAFGLILVIACANVANLLLARAVARQREIGIRLSLGATRRRIVRQLLTESLLLALVAAAAGFAISRVALAAIVNAVATSWPPEIGDFRSFVPDADWRVALFLIVGAGVSTMFFGLVPALQATRIEPIRTIRGEGVRDARPGRARNVLIGLQVSASALLLISAAVFLRSAFAAATFDPGLRIADIVIVQIANEPNRNAIVQAVTAEPSVAAVAASWPAVVASPRGAFVKVLRQAQDGALRQAQDGALRQAQDGALRQAQDGALRQAQDGALRQAQDGALRQAQDGALRQAQDGALRQAQDGALRQAQDGALRQAQDGALRQAQDGALRQAQDGALRQAQDGALRQAQDGALRQAQDGALRQAQDGALRQAQDGALRQAQDGALRQAQGGALRQAQDGALRQAQDGALRQAQGGALRQAQGGALRQAQGGALRQAQGGALRQAQDSAAGAKAAVAYQFVSAEYFSVLGIAVVRGRVFTAAERSSNLSVAIVSEATALELWPHADALGQVVRLDPDTTSEPRRAERGEGPPRLIHEPPLESRTFTVVGVVRNVPGFRIAPAKQAVVYVPTNATMPMTSLVARVRGDPELARQTLLTRLTSIDPTINLEQVATLQWVTRMETYLLKVGFWLTVVLGGLALALTLSGLFSVLSYLVEQRTQEIGVRMALGATTRHITRLVLSQSIRPVGVGLFIGGGSTAGLAALLLASTAAGSIGQIVHVLDPVAYAVSLLIIVACLMAASIPATRAARLDPTRTLRQE